MASVAVDMGPPTDVILGNPQANQEKATFIPPEGPTSLDKAKSFQQNRIGRFTKIVDAVATGKVQPNKLVGNIHHQQIAEAGQTTPESGETQETPVETQLDTSATEANDSVGEDVTEEAAVEQSRMERIQAATAKNKADAARNRQRQAQARQRDAELAQMRQQNEQLRQQAARGYELEQSLKKDPLAAFKQAGLTTEQLVQKALQEGSPEGQIEALKQVVLQERQERLALEAKNKMKEYEVGLRAAEEAVWERAKNHERYPHLKGHPKTIIVATVKQVARDAQEYAARNKLPAPVLSDGQLLRYLDSLYAEEVEDTGDQTATNSKATDKSGKSGKAATASTKAAAPRTLTSRLAAGSASRPKGFEQLPRNERMKFLRAELKK